MSPTHGAARRGGLLSLLVQRKKQRKHTPAVRPPQAAGAQSQREFSDGASCPGRKRRTSLCGAPTGFYPPGPPDLRGSKSQSRCVHARDLHLLLLVSSGPHEARRVGRVKPEGRRPGWAAFSYGTWMCLTKIPGPLADPERSAGRAAWGVFLCFFLCTSKERRPPRRAAPYPRKRNPIPQGHRTKGRRGCGGDSQGRPKDTVFVAPHPNPSPAGRGTSEA